MRGFEPVLDPISTLLAVSFEKQLPLKLFANQSMRFTYVFLFTARHDVGIRTELLCGLNV